jgi:hypothetical protein
MPALLHRFRDGIQLQPVRTEARTGAEMSVNMDASARHKAKLEAFLKKMKPAQLQDLCAKGALKPEGSRTALAGRISEAANVAHLDFGAIDLDNLPFLQLLGKCIEDGLPTEGRR